MSKFLYTLSIILVIAKIFALVSFSWGVCLLPAFMVITYKLLFGAWALNQMTVILKEINEENDEEE